MSAPRSATRTGALLAAVAVGMLVAVGIGVYGRVHQAAFFAFDLAGFSSGTAAKAWLATFALMLAIVQLLSGMAMYGRLGSPPPAWMATLHRWSGRLAVLVTVPVAVHCLYAFGFQPGSVRVLVHSLAGCFLYGIFVAKMLVLPRSGMPRWAVPVLGGALFTALTVLWLTSAAWFFGTSGLTI